MIAGALALAITTSGLFAQPTETSMPTVVASPEATSIPAVFGDPSKPTELRAALYRPPGTGPFPLVILSHGRPRDDNEARTMTPDYVTASRWFASRGYVVLVVLRRGYGGSGGSLVEDYGSCANPDYFRAGEITARDILATLDFMRNVPFVDQRRVLLVGHSAGGWGTLAAIGHNPPGVVGAVVFAPGRGSNYDNHVCVAENLVEAARAFGASTHIPTIWLSAPNDRFLAPELESAMFDAFSASHPTSDTFIRVRPFAYPGRMPSESDGHQFIHFPSALPLWTPAVQSFLDRL